MSSLFDNPWLIRQLLRIATQSDSQLVKRGQDQTAQQNAAALQQQIKALQNQFRSSTDAGKISTESDSPVGLQMIDLQNLGSLVMFLYRAKITMGGKRIAYSPDEVQFQNPPDDTYHVYKLQGSATLTPVRSNALVDTKTSFLVSRDLLVKYIRSLQAQNAKQPNPVLTGPLQAIIQQANGQLQTTVGEYKEPEKTLPPGTEVDRTPKVLDLKTWGQAGEVVLTIDDITSPEALNSWFTKTGVAVKSATDGKPATIRDQDFDPCAGIQVLYKRAQSLVRRATVQSKDQATIYLRQMTAIATQSKCDLSRIGGHTQSGSGNPQTLQELVAIQPFNSQYINTRDIRSFVDKFAALANDQQVNALKQQVDMAIQRVNSLMPTPGAPIQMNNLTALGFKLQTGTPQPLQLASILHTIVSVAGRVYQLFLIQYQNTLGGAARPAQQQISAQQANVEDLVELIQNLTREGMQQGLRR